jgi:hypothetical protein
MKNLKDFINESIVNESDPRGDFKVIEDMPTDFMWEHYDFILDGKSDEPELMEDICKESDFEGFLKYAKKNRWKKTKNGYYIVPEGTELKFDSHLRCASHMGMWEINGDGVYLTMMYDEVRYGEMDEYLMDLYDWYDENE